MRMRADIIPRSDRQGFRSPSRSKSRGKSRGKSISRAARSSRNNSRYFYDDDDNSRRDSVSSNLAEDGDNVSISDQSNIDGFACGLCDPVCCGEEVTFEDKRDSDELRELRREIDDMKRMIKPTAVSVVEKSGVPPSPPRSPREGPPSPQSQSNGKLIKLFDNDLVQVETEDEQERLQRERYYTSLGRQGYIQQDEQGGTWADLLQCSNFCIMWNNCEISQDDNMSDISPITDAMELPWSDDYQRNVIEAPTMRAEPLQLSPVNSRKARPSYSAVSNIRQNPSYAVVSVSPTKKTLISKAVTAATPSTKSMSKSTPSSNGKNSVLPLNKLARLPRSPLQSRNKKPKKAKAKKVIDDETGSIMFEC